MHGAGLRDKTFGINYWGRIACETERSGIKVYYGETDAWGTIENNAQILKEKIENILKENGNQKINIIAHSRGGLESRYLISSLHLHNSIASLTTISTPHNGVKAINITLYIPSFILRIVSFFVDLCSKIIGDKKPNFYKSIQQLSEKECKKFNIENKDNELVYYQSYTAKIKYFFSDLLFIFLYLVLIITDGENDGMCPVKSAEWGNFKGVITTKGIFGISHFGILDGYRIKYRDLDIPKFYLSILRELSEKGF